MAKWNFEAQLNAADIFLSGEGLPIQGAGYLHLWDRLSSSAWGVFAGVAPFEINFTSVGGEFVHYLPHASFGAAVAFTDLSEISSSGWTLNGTANFYFNPNLRVGIQGAGLFGLSGLSGLGTNDLWQVSADIEHRSSMHPLSLFASTSYGSELGFNSWTVEGGFRIFLDKPGSTLQSHEQDVPFTFALPQLLLP